MTWNELEGILHNITHGKKASIALKGLNDVAMLERLLRNILLHKAVARVEFVGYFSPTQRAVINNAYISALFHDRKEHIQQLSTLDSKYHLRLGFNFDYTVNHKKYDLALDGLNARAVLKPSSKKLVESFPSRAPRMMMEAIRLNDIRTMLKAHYADVDFDQVIDGRVPIEYACSLGRISMVMSMANLGATLTLPNHAGVNALDQICALDLYNLLFDLIDQGLLKPTPFIDKDGTIVADDTNIIRRLIDRQNPVFLNRYFIRIYTRNGVYFPDCTVLRRIDEYAYRTNNTVILEWTGQYGPYVYELEERLYAAVSLGNMQEVEACLLSHVDVNMVRNRHSLLQAACQANSPSMLECLRLYGAQHYRLKYFKFKSPDPAYEQHFDPLYLCVIYDSVETLEYCLDTNFCNYDNKYDPGLLRDLHSLALENNSARILAYLEQLLQRLVATHDLLFELIAQGAYQKVREMFLGDAHPNTLYNGRGIIHLLATDNALAAIRSFVENEGMDINLADQDDNYPITIACTHGFVGLVKFLLSREECRVYHFYEVEREGYTLKLDPIRLSIDNDHADLLNELVKIADRASGADARLPKPILDNVLRWYHYAADNRKPYTKALLKSYVDRLQARQPLFKFDNDGALQSLITRSQTVSDFDISAVVAVQKLAKHYNLELITAFDDTTRQNVTSVKTDKYNFTEIFAQLQGMIDNCQDYSYTFYRYVIADDGKKVKVSRQASKEEYVALAQAMYDDMVIGTKGYAGTYNTWRMKWPMGDTLVDYAGPLSRDVWCLVIIAALDSKTLSDQDPDTLAYELQRRRDLLVRTLVECKRTYYTDNDEDHDYEDLVVDPDKPSCVHGVSTRPLLAFSYLHPAIAMQSNPLPWAMQEAKVHFLKFFHNHPQSVIICRIASYKDEQLSPDNRTMLEQFYIDAKLAVEKALEETVGRLRFGGYLRDEQFKVVLDNISYIDMPVTYDAEADMLSKQPEFTLCDAIAVPCDDKARFAYILPSTVDSIFAAILLAAREQNIEIDQAISSVPRLRSKLVNIISLAPSVIPATATEPEHYSLFDKQNFTTNTGMQSLSAYIIAKRLKIEDLYTGRQAYLKSLTDTSAPSLLLLEIVAALLSVNIKFYDEFGAHLFDVSGYQFMRSVKPIESNLYICTPKKYEFRRSYPDFLNAYPLIDIANLQRVIEFLPYVGVRDTEQQLQADNRSYPAYKIMSGRNLVFDTMPMWQVLMPLEPENMLNAVWMAARNIDHIQALSIANVDALRTQIHAELCNMLSNGTTRYADMELTPEFLVYVATPNTVLPVGVYGIVADLWQININIYVVEGRLPLRFTVVGAEHDLYLIKMRYHCNILVPIRNDGWKMQNETESLPGLRSKRPSQEALSGGEQIERPSSRVRLMTTPCP